MDECRPFRAVRAAKTEMVFVYGNQAVDSQMVCPEALAELLNEVYDTDIRDASRHAREYIERERSWPRARDAMSRLLTA
jgi:hypothetical protein